MTGVKTHTVDMDWTTQAACADHPDLTWHPPPGRVTPAVEIALLVCRDCPVRRQCLAAADALEAPWEAHGIWGGLTASERVRRRSWLDRRNRTVDTTATPPALTGAT